MPGKWRAFETVLLHMTSAGLPSSLPPPRGSGSKVHCGLWPSASYAPRGRKGEKLKNLYSFFQEEHTPEGADGTSCDVSL